MELNEIRVSREGVNYKGKYIEVPKLHPKGGLLSQLPMTSNVGVWSKQSCLKKFKYTVREGGAREAAIEKAKAWIDNQAQ